MTQQTWSTQELVTEYLKERRARGERTATTRVKREVLEKLIEDFPRMPCDRDAFLTWAKGPPFRVPLFNTYRRNLTLFFQWCQEAHGVPLADDEGGETVGAKVPSKPRPGGGPRGAMSEERVREIVREEMVTVLAVATNTERYAAHGPGPG